MIVNYKRSREAFPTMKPTKDAGQHSDKQEE